MEKILEVVVLGQFVMERFFERSGNDRKSWRRGCGWCKSVAHLAGALAGVVLIASLSKILPE